jgi:hypothetical protein
MPMLDQFTPFTEYENEEAACVKLQEIFACDTLPEIRLNGDTLYEPYWRHSKRSYEYTMTLTEHVAYMLGQPDYILLSCQRGASDDRHWRYETLRVSTPAWLSGTNFEPCYMKWMLPDEYDPHEGATISDDERIPALVDVCFEPGSTGYCLGLPGSAVVALSDMTLVVPKKRAPKTPLEQLKYLARVVVDPFCFEPRWEMTCTTREHIMLDHYWSAWKKRTQKQNL